MDVGETLTVRDREQWRGWLARHHQARNEIWLVYYKKTSGKTGINYDESVEEALAYRWIDGQIKGLDAERYAARFTPRKPGSKWSESNIARLKKLLAEDRMAEPGLRLVPASLKKTLPRLRGRVRVGAS